MTINFYYTCYEFKHVWRKILVNIASYMYLASQLWFRCFRSVNSQHRCKLWQNHLVLFSLFLIALVLIFCKLETLNWPCRYFCTRTTSVPDFLVAIYLFLQHMMSSRRVTKESRSSYPIPIRLDRNVTSKIGICKIPSHFELLTRRFLQRSSTLSSIKFPFELQTRRLNFYFFTFELLIRSWKIKSSTFSY